ncbi:MAG: phosphoethanolamine--lipid A transferase [Cypionkella sp.]|nr:phosphoethanolamine--lipid A transferase [Cypionkella sp.]
MSRPTLRATTLSLLVALFIFATGNWTFLRLNAQVFDGQPLQMITYAAIGFCMVLFATSLLAPPFLQKPVLILVLLISAGASHFQDTLGVLIDREMIQNVANSNSREAGRLISAALVIRLLLCGILPSLFVMWVRLRPAQLWRRVLAWVGTWVGAVLLFALLVGTNFKAYYAVIRGHHELEASLQPSASIGAIIKYGALLVRSANIKVEPLGLDAKSGPRLAGAVKPVVMVLVVGETARSKNFSLGGYERPTNPEMAKRGVLFFDSVTCATSSAVSLPCMFSHLSRDDYSYEAAAASENLLDVLGHAGFAVEWLENNETDYDVAKRAKITLLTSSPDPAVCGRGECNDSILLSPLRQIIEKATRNTVIVLHTVGSHGPPYYLRYPLDFEPFKPACQSVELSECSDAEIVNAYDNTIAYTDLILSQIIDMLNDQDRVIPALLYQSDHGESLGENGVYLHSAPYFIAPDEQTHTPLLAWLSPRFETQLGVTMKCLAGKAHQQVSQDNFFHTTLGLLNIQTTVRDPALDLAEGCASP